MEMASYLEELQHDAERAIAAMKSAAITARQAHAKAELVRHMLTTARKVRDLPRAEAIETVVGEWMRAWHLDRDAWPHVAREMEALTGAFYDYARAASPEGDGRIREAHEALKAVIETPDLALEDHMAWRSRCAHGWWNLVRPAPDALRRPKESAPDAPFWMQGCPRDCL
jgi:hypothetical protein